MNAYRIFTNDRGTRGGIPLYSCLKEVKATSPEVARRTCPARFDAPNYAPAVAIHWPASTQSDDEKEWLKKHVGKGSGRLMVRQHPLMAPPAARRASTARPIPRVADDKGVSIPSVLPHPRPCVCFLETAGRLEHLQTADPLRLERAAMTLHRMAHEHMIEVQENLELIQWIEKRLGSVNISAAMWRDYPQDAQESFGWTVWPEDETRVLVYGEYNQGPGSGPRSTLRECLNDLRRDLSSAAGIAIGRPGLRPGPPPELLMKLHNGEIVA